MSGEKRKILVTQARFSTPSQSLHKYIADYVKCLKHRDLANTRLSTYNFPTFHSPCSHMPYKKIYWEAPINAGY